MFWRRSSRSITTHRDPSRARDQALFQEAENCLWYWPYALLIYLSFLNSIHGSGLSTAGAKTRTRDLVHCMELKESKSRAKSRKRASIPIRLFHLLQLRMMFHRTGTLILSRQNVPNPNPAMIPAVGCPTPPPAYFSLQQRIEVITGRYTHDKDSG